MQRVTLLGVPIDPITQADAVTSIKQYLNEDKGHHIATPNNEMLVAAHRDADFRAILHLTSLNLPDSTGLLLMAKWTGQTLPERVTGVDTVINVMKELDDQSPIFLLGAAEGVAEKAAAALKDQNQKLKVAGTFSGSPKDADAPVIIKKINDSGAKLLLVAFGAPAQEKWIAKNLVAMPFVRVAMGVGGTFDFLAGTKKRAPGLMRAMGLEWLWRFLLEPSRLPRILRAVIVFPLLVLRYGKDA